MYPALPKSYKGFYPFRIGSTSFIYPDGYVENVRMLAPYLDEIELLLFESAPSSLPSEKEMKALLLLAENHDLTYNIHMPTDISLSHPDPLMRNRAIKIYNYVIEFTAALSPSTYTLHLPYCEKDFKTESIKKWEKRIYNCTKQFINSGINGKNISIETLMYPFKWVKNILDDFNLSVCIDIGHLILSGLDPADVFQKYKQKTSIIHLHGVKNDNDHLALNKLSAKHSDTVKKILKQFRGVVSVEVFSYDDLKSSLAFLEKLLNPS